MPHSHLQKHNRFIQLIPPTPLVPVCIDDNGPTVWCKLEFLNPSGSTKDRMARYILEKAWRSGRVKPGMHVIEASSGSTSIAFALACAQMGLKFTAVMPEGVSNERVLIIRAYGGDIHLVPKEQGILGAMRWAEQQAEKLSAFLPRQFENPDNPEAHRVSTGQEILSQIPEGMVDAVVSGVGTGGTLVGLYRAFAEAGCPVQPFVAKPITAGTHFEIECCSFSVRIPGVADGLSKLYSKTALPNVVELEVSDSDAIEMTQRLIASGFPVGPSSGLNYCASLEVAKRLGKNAAVVTVFPDRMERYFSTELFSAIKQSAEAILVGKT
jgi:cysteine synthase A